MSVLYDTIWYNGLTLLGFKCEDTFLSLKFNDFGKSVSNNLVYDIQWYKQ